MSPTRGKVVGLEALSNDRGVIAAAAMDQRGSLKKALQASGEKDITAGGVEEFKTLVMALSTAPGEVTLAPDGSAGKRPQWLLVIRHGIDVGVGAGDAVALALAVALVVADVLGLGAARQLEPSPVGVHEWDISISSRRTLGWLAVIVSVWLPDVRSLTVPRPSSPTRWCLCCP